MRVATLNLFNNAHGRWEDRAALVTDQAREIGADAYAFQEVAATTDQVDRLLDALGPEYVAVRLDNPVPESIKSLAIVTRLAVAEHDACLDLPGGDVALAARLEQADGGAFTFATTHLHYSPTREGSALRLRQATLLLEWLPDRLGPVVVAGDFNATPTGSTIARMKTRFQSAHDAARGREPAGTHPTPLLQVIDTMRAFGVETAGPLEPVPIDYIFISAHVAVLDCRLAWTSPSEAEPNLYPSDHYGLVADLRLPVS